MSVVVLNASYEPLGGVSFQHAVKMLFREVAVVEEAAGDRMIGPHPWPRVIRLLRYVKTAWKHSTRPAMYSKSAVLRRDKHRCAYCRRPGSTIDHILPRSRGGTSTWMNTVTACSSCNQKKANKTPEEAGMRLQFQPYVPTKAELNAASRTR